MSALLAKWCVKAKGILKVESGLQHDVDPELCLKVHNPIFSNGGGHSLAASKINRPSAPSMGLDCLFLHQEPAVMVACLELKEHTPGLHVLETEILSCLRTQMRIVKGAPLFSRS